jgi:hypothetical protein
MGHHGYGWVPEWARRPEPEPEPMPQRKRMTPEDVEFWNTVLDTWPECHEWPDWLDIALEELAPSTLFDQDEMFPEARFE